MEMHQIRYFLAVEKERNFSRAAEACNITQPALTRAIQKLEEEVGGSLFNRRPGRIELTELGRALLPRLTSALQQVTEARSQALSLTRLRQQRLRLGVMCTVGPARMTQMVKGLLAGMPMLDLTLREAKGTQIVSDLMNDEIDVAIAGLPTYADAIEVTPLYQEHYVVAMAREHRLASANAVDLNDIDGENYIERTDCEFDDHFDFSHGQWPINLTLKYRSNREDWVQSMIAAGVGISIMPHSLPLIPGVCSAALVAPEVSRTISVLTLKDRPPTAAGLEFVKGIKSQTWG